MITISTPIAEEIAHHAISWYASESCGLLFAAKGSTDCVRCVCMENLQDKYHEKMPEDFPRTSVDAFKLNEREVMKLDEAAHIDGQRLLAIFHSHVDCGAYFSEEDILMAAPFGEPSDPEMWHVVLDCQKDGVHGAKAYKWNGSTFGEHILEDFPRVTGEGVAHD
ncbi:MAG: Mov34/MPN/PAD-1 family protein [Planctomycetes bacterium]|nr:Mov34/MPN/PAD-1 family protein [Planctomycetota bacterium]